MPESVAMEGVLVRLAPLDPSLLADYHRWNNDRDTQRLSGFPDPPGERSLEGTRGWLERARASEDPRWWTLVEVSTGRAIGHVNLRDIDRHHGTAEMGITIGEKDARGRGYGTEAVKLLLAYAFEEAGLHNVMIDVFAYNPAALRAYQKAGFREVGRRREAQVWEGTRHDVILLDALASEWKGAGASRGG